MEKVLSKITELKEKYEDLKKKSYKDGGEEHSSLSQFLRRAIDRIYPEKDATNLKRQLYHIAYFGGEQTEAEKQEEYIDHINMALRVINTIIEEAEVFGFDDFKPIREKTEIGLNKGKPSLFRRWTKRN